MKSRNRVAALLAVPVLTLAMAACSSDEGESVVTDAPETDKISEAVSGDGDRATTTTDGDATTTMDQAPIGQDAATVQVAGRDVDGEFTPVRCTLDRDDDTMEIHIGNDDADTGKVEIEIKGANDDPKLEKLEIDSANLDIEVDDDNADGAVVTRDGDKWTITGVGKYSGEDRTDEVRVEALCPVN